MQVKRSFFTFGGESSLDYGLTIEQPQIARKPKRQITRISVPGRDGDVIYDEGAYSNVDLSYRVWCGDESARDAVLARVGELSRWLTGGKYKMLSDTYDPDYFRLAMCVEPLEPELLLRKYAKQDVAFTCDPYRYSFAGNEVISFNQQKIHLYNTGMASLPYIKVYGQGEVALFIENRAEDGTTRTDAWTLTVDNHIELDSATMNTTKDGVDCNYKKSGAGYPVFLPGEIVIDLSQRATGVDIIPRWRVL